MKITRIKNVEPSKVADGLRNAFKKLGYDVYVSVEGKAVDLSQFRLSDDWVENYGRNVNAFSGRRGRYLGWDNWVQVNNAVNKVLDRLKASANVRTLKGVFKIREGTRKYTESDWEERAYDNVGSIMNPVMRKDQWYPENPQKVKEKLSEVV